MKHTKFKRTVAVLAMALLACTVCISFTACNPDLDPETRPFSMSISTPDGVFNPFFSTSAYDSTIIGMTQIAMLNTDKEGKIVCGEIEPTVVKDYYLDESEAGYTTYKFLIKNGVKWSNGSDLTIKDVLFNLYVYLDPVYTGSATIYSTDIVGLQQYRQQTLDDVTSGGTSSFEASFIADANRRVDNDITYIQMKGKGINQADRPDHLPEGFTEDQAISDFAFIGKTFYEELVSDYNAINVEDYEDWGFTEKWQIFFMNDGGDSGFLKHQQNNDQLPYEKDEYGNYQLNEIYSDSKYVEILESVDMNGTDDEVDARLRDYCVKYVFEQKFTSHFPQSVRTSQADRLTLSPEEKAAIETAIQNVFVNEFEIVAKYWNTATTILTKYTADAKTEYFKKNPNRLVSTISGITTERVSEFNGTQLGEEYDVLKIKINGIDPKAIYNFSFSVSPMWYYSTTNWGGKNYIEAFDAATGNFGLEFGDINFMNEVINASSKIRLPMGGGAYMATDEDGNDLNADNASGFFRKNMVYYKRNPYFETLGSGLENAKIKYVRYKVVESDQIINALANGDIDLGDPSATQTNEQLLKQKGLETVTVNTNGYGYVGINPRFVPDVNVRRAIMKAFDTTTIINNYYKGGFGDQIWRPMTRESWAYPKEATAYVSRSSGGIGKPNTSYAFDRTGTEIEDLVEYAGYTKNSNGVYEKTIANFGTDTLNYKFTIAGGSTDHPAYSMFLDAAALLNAHGFDVKVVTSQQALSDLSSGKLAVWAAAWSSTIDPDMFQVYHMDSQASSTKNWGYAQILGGTSAAAWGDELPIVQQLSEVIDQARQVNGEAQRKPLYYTALDWVMELAVEFPSYQRRDLTAYQGKMLDPKTLPSEDDITSYSGLLARIWEINYIS